MAQPFRFVGTQTKALSSTTTLITYPFTGRGAWSNAVNWNNKAIPPAMLPANTEIIVDPASGQCVLDVTERISTGAKLTVKSGKMITVPGAVIIQYPGFLKQKAAV